MSGIDGVYAYGYRCLSRLDPKTNMWFLPEILISINFTQLDPDVLIANPSASQKVCDVVIGLTVTEDAILERLQRIPSFPLLPGMNLVAAIVTDLRKVLLSNAWATFGIFQVRLAQCHIIGLY